MTTPEPDVHVEIDEDIFNDVYIPLLDDMAPTQILFGGSSSGKSNFYAQRCVYDILCGGRNYLVVRKVADTLNMSVRTEITKAIKAMGLESEFNIPKSTFTITCTNGYQIMFGGLDDVEKLKSITPQLGVITDIWIEEATEVTQDDIKQLEKRMRGGEEDTPKRLMMSFNPILQTHHIYKNYFQTLGWKDDQTIIRLPNLSITKTTYKDNRFLTQQDIARLENETDAYYYNVYTLGKWGILGNIIFKNWSVEDLSDKRYMFTNHRHGGDFGFGGAPSAISVRHYDRDRKIIYCYDELYEKELTNDVLAEKTKKLIPLRDDNGEVIGTQPIVWDSAEPKSIKELRIHGVNALSAVKGPDSILHGIQWLQQQTMIFDVKAIHHREEFSMLKWKEDRKTGEVLEEPVGADHLVDANRYGSERDMIPRGKARQYEG